MNPECFRPQEIALDADCVFRALWRREQASSTALGDGIAIPHARIEGIAKPLTFYMRTRNAIAFGAPDGQPVSHILVILVPADGDPEAHLQLLAWIAAKFSEPAFRANLAAARTMAEVDQVFAGESRARYGARGADVAAGAGQVNAVADATCARCRT